MLMALTGKNTYQAWAQQVSIISNKLVTKQGLFDRMGASAVQMACLLLEDRLKIAYGRVKNKGLFKHFYRVLIHDSTNFKLPDSLVKYYPGNKVNGKQKALVRIQSVYDILHNQFCFFGLSPHTANDQSAASSIKTIIRKGDLVIRDLGYFVMKALQEIINAEAYFLTRIPYSICVYKLTDEIKHDLLTLLNKKEHFDEWILLSEQSKLKARLVAIKLPEHIASERRRKARHHADKRYTYSRKYLKLLSYALYATNVDKKVWSSMDIITAYKLRWNIEIIFKSWKSGFQIQQLLHKQCFNVQRVKCTIYLMLLFITLFQLKLYDRFNIHVLKKHNKHISILKLATFICKNFIFTITSKYRIIERFLIKYCCYESRTDRVNQMELVCNYPKLT
jgi:hypothetical protein